jgi:ABC-type Fe3+ transport system permease subunit
MYCTNCGARNDDNAYQCTSCGQVLQRVPLGATAGKVPSYLAQAILATLFCCLPFGIVAIVYAAQVDGKWGAGDYEGAIDASNKARTWCWVSFGIGLATLLLYFLFVVLTAVVRNM